MTLITFSSGEIAEGDRSAALSDVLNALFRLEIVNLSDDVGLSTSLRRFPDGVVVATSAYSPIAMVRAATHVADGNDDFILSIPLEGRSSYAQPGRQEQMRGPFEGYVLLNDRPSEIRNEHQRRLSLAIPRVALTGANFDINRILADGIPPTPALRLLAGYVQALTAERDELPGALGRLAATHVCDLVALALGATGAAEIIARERGVRAARLAAIKSDITARIAESDLSIESVARRLAISPRYIQALLRGEGTTFRDVVLSKRLERAHLQLRDPARTGLSIAEIAYASGFGDLSYFNQTFRRRFGMTPGDVRRAHRDHIPASGTPKTPAPDDP
jgi:AraC-like DNA-binding protein